MRKTNIVIIDQAGRDEGKMFMLTEMPAYQSEEWAMRAFHALAATGIDVPPNIFAAGMEGLAVLGIKAMAMTPWAELKPLLEDMMACVQVVRDKRHPDVAQELLHDDIEEPGTYLRLRGEVLALHMGFSLADVVSKLTAPATTTDQNSPNPRTSPQPAPE